MYGIFIGMSKISDISKNLNLKLNGGIVYRKSKSKKTISNYKPPKIFEKYEINQMKEFNRA